MDRRLLCHCHIQSGLTYVLKTIGSRNSTDQPVLYYTVNLAFLNYFSTFLNGSDNIPSNPMEDETVLPIAKEDFSKDPDFPVYCQDSSMFPTFFVFGKGFSKWLLNVYFWKENLPPLGEFHLDLHGSGQIYI